MEIKYPLFHYRSTYVLLIFLDCMNIIKIEKYLILKQHMT